MPKMKTKKAVAKKIRVTKRGKALRRTTGQNHYNAKETGKVGRAKRRDRRLFKADEKNVLRSLQA
ncbi:50S ribosomal protein L35 [Patescibacteria group bacterium]|nr:MAG: 50S ribosomal protein L35 [Patescibacteria group bacterium]